MKKTRHEMMTHEQLARWEEAEKREGKRIPRTHENCMRILSRTVKVPARDEHGEIVKGKWTTKVVKGPARPGKTAKDRANKIK